VINVSRPQRIRNGRLKNQKNSSAHKLCDRGELAWLINRKQIIRKRNLGTSVLRKSSTTPRATRNPSYQGNKRFWNLPLEEFLSVTIYGVRMIAAQGDADVCDEVMQPAGTPVVGPRRRALRRQRIRPARNHPAADQSRPRKLK